MSSPSKRRDTDLMKLMMSNFEVMLGEANNNSDFFVKFRAPPDCVYSGGIYKIHVILPLEYPYKSPSIGFCNRIFHPNIDEASGSVCLDVINQTWSPMYDLRNIFNIFLPQLLLYPNPSDPLNPAAAKMFYHKKEEFDSKCRSYVATYASVDFKTDNDDDDDTPPVVKSTARPAVPAPTTASVSVHSGTVTPNIAVPVSSAASHRPHHTNISQSFNDDDDDADTHPHKKLKEHSNSRDIHCDTTSDESRGDDDEEFDAENGVARKINQRRLASGAMEEAHDDDDADEEILSDMDDMDGNMSD